MADRFEDDLRIAIMRLGRRMRLERADGTVTDGQLSVLFALRKEGPQSLGSLSEHEGVTPPSMNRTVNALVEAGYVTRETATDDARKVDIAITDAGVAIVTETKRRRVAWFSQRIARLSARERAALETAADILRELADS
jgi:DNA-binding MarR family transcriptional regulator